jgi:hypothetical protein
MTDEPKSISFIRNVQHSSTLRPEPNITLAINAVVPDICARSLSDLAPNPLIPLGIAFLFAEKYHFISIGYVFLTSQVRQAPRTDETSLAVITTGMRLRCCTRFNPAISPSGITKTSR